MSSFQRLFLKSTYLFIDENCQNECFHDLLAKDHSFLPAAEKSIFSS
jgi:hypothetical protein